MATAGTSPLFHPQFRRLYAAQVFSLVAFGVATVGLALLAYDLVGGSAGAVLGMAFGLKMAAKLFIAPIAGAYGPRLPRKVLLSGVELVRVALLLCLPFVDAVWQLYALIVAMSACEAVFNPAFEAILPDLFPDTARYAKALSLSRIAINGETLASPLLAAAVLLYMSFDGLFFIASAASLAAALFILLATIPPVTVRPAKETRFLIRVSHGIRSYFATAELRGVLIVYLSIALASAMLIVNTVVYVRDVLVPINRKYPLKDLIQACRDYPTLKNSNRITFEYVMLKGVNDSPADARALLELIKGIPAKINLIPFNAWPGAPYECSDDAAIDAFAKIIWNAGYSSPVRTPRGRDIMAACGQLKSASERQRKRRRAKA